MKTNQTTTAIDRLSMLVMASFALPAFAQTSNVRAPDNEQQSQRGLEEVIVTAQKRQQIVQDIPMSVTALSGDALTERHIDNVLELSRMVPSLAVTEGSPGQQIVTIRGMGGIRGSSSLTGLYLDEVPVSGAGQLGGTYPDLRAIDLERVEVLKGPQGTLFGESSVGGAVRYITRDPDLENFGGSISMQMSQTDDGGLNEEITGVLNLPIVPGLFGARLAALYENNSGWIDQPSVGREDINDNKLTHVRLKALFTPTPELAIEGLVLLHRNDVGATNIVNQAPFEEGNFVQATDFDPLDPLGPGNRNGPTSQQNDYDIYGLTVTYDFGFAELLSSTSYSETRNVNNATQLVGQLPVPILEIYSQESVWNIPVFTEEVRLSSAGDGPLNWTLGASYRDLENRLPPNGIGGDAIVNEGLLAGLKLIGLLADQGSRATSESWSGFGFVSYELTEQLELGGGARYFEDTRTAESDPFTSASAASAEFNASTYRAYVKFTPSREVNIYLNVADGFRSGGLNNPGFVALGAPATFGVENSLSYELGLKFDSPESRFRLNAAVFYTEYDDLQDDISTVIGPNIVQYTSNGQAAEVRGIEFEANWSPTDNLHLSFNGSLIDTEITWIDPLTVSATYEVGDPINLVPDYNFSFAADYDFHWAASVPGALRMSYTAQGVTHFTERSNILIIDKQTTSPEIGFLYAGLEADFSGWNVSVFGTNLLNERDPINPAPTGWTAQARPRSVGLTLSKAF